MAAVSVWVPVYTVGDNGEKAYQFAKLTGTISNRKIPEGEVMIDSRVVGLTPAAALQPPDLSGP